MRKRTAFTLLMKGIESGWSIPDEAIREGVETARSMLADRETPSREKIRAAELLLMARDRESERLLKLAELEEAVESRIESERVTKHDTETGEPADMAGLVAMLKAEGPELARRHQATREIIARKAAQAAAAVRPGDEASLRQYNATMKVLMAAFNLTGLVMLDHMDQTRRLTAELERQQAAEDDDGELIPPIDPAEFYEITPEEALGVCEWEIQNGSVKIDETNA